MELEGKTFLCIGGADSYDEEWRAEYEKIHGEKIWWKEETISDSDLDNAIANLEVRDFKVNYILTHCTPTTFILKAELYQNPILSESEKKLDKILEIVDFDEWFCGHVHTDKTIVTGGKKITSLKIDKSIRI